MKKYLAFMIIFFLGCLLSGCPNWEGTTTYITIKSVKTFVFSFDDNGIFPHLDDFKRNELGIGIYLDSISERLAYSNSSSSSGYAAYAIPDPDETIYTNRIDSLNVLTIYDYDENHKAGSSVNDILRYLDGASGDTVEGPIEELEGIGHSLKFIASPQKDSLQFEITGRITEEGNFKKLTNLVVLIE